MSVRARASSATPDVQPPDGQPPDAPTPDGQPPDGQPADGQPPDGQPAVRGTAVRRAVRVRGVVQGVGFRPFVYALATELGLSGEVRNDTDGVLAQVQGPAGQVEAFCRRVADDAPPLAAVERVEWTAAPVRPGDGFVITASASTNGRTLVPADVATCPDCLTELRDPADRRSRHPFITCTNCGPRFTIVTGLPYDRPSTTMRGFPLCPDCAREYADPADRRFHAQPVSCHRCGPVLELVEPGADPRYREDALTRARSLLAAGRILAVKGIGGYHLACDATDPVAVQRLRERKRRGDKPFAVLVADLATARAIADVGDAEAALLTSPRAPVVLLRRRSGDGAASGAGGPVGAAPDAGVGNGAALDAGVRNGAAPEAGGRVGAAPEAGGRVGAARDAGVRNGAGSAVAEPGGPVGSVAEAVAPGNPDLGVMLPPTGLHHLLLGLPGDPPGPRVLVLTSGNLSSEPIVTDDAEALERLRGIADAWLRHDRPIHVPCDDSVVRVVGAEELPVRRSRGFAPLPVALPVEVEPALAVGGDLKNTFCVGQGRYAWLSAHVGDMDDLATQQAFERSVQHLSALVDVRPEVLVADRHPGYRSAQWARHRAGRDGLPVREVQHHHAHVAAVMAEHGLDGTRPVIGIAFDGTGYGDDGAVWGGELLLADYDGFERFAHLSYVPLAGGDAAVRRPYRMALAHLRAAGVPWDDDLPCVAACPPAERRVLDHQLRTGLATTPTSSAGRLFDAVASLAGICHEVGFEAQAAMALEAAAVAALGPANPAGGRPGELTGGGPDAADPDPVGAYPLPLIGGPEEGPAGGVWDCGTLVRAVVADVRAGVPAGLVAARFHRGLAAAVVASASVVRQRAGLEVVALSGGVFCNAVLLALTVAGLTEAGFTVLRHRRVPPNDGGLGLGQIVVGARRRVHGRG